MRVFGGADDFKANVDYSDKVALVQRGGDLSFVQKFENAAAHDVAGLIVFNHEAGGEELINMAGLTGSIFPRFSWDILLVATCGS